MRCPRIQSCSLHDQVDRLSALRIWQATYCERSFDACLRYRALAAEEVAAALEQPFAFAPGPGPAAVSPDPG
jgi:hypothetical protein